jgi:uncharacterized protein YigE (DUF2233 family)
LKRWLTVVAVMAAGAVLAMWLLMREGPDGGAGRLASIPAADMPAPCREITFEQARHVVCEIDLTAFSVGIFHSGSAGRAYGSLDAFDAAQDPPVILAMNAGMYHEGLGPVGLLVSNGAAIAPVNTADGEGNFFLKPNGVFGIDADGSAFVQETGAFVASARRPKEATQSGPMLVIDGSIHPRFQPDGESRYIRNGVGTRDGRTMVLAISLDKVSLGSFARLFRDELQCPNALFLDGGISSLSNGRKTLIGDQHPVGPILAVLSGGGRS